jgi:hypothetical protein
VAGWLADATESPIWVRCAGSDDIGNAAHCPADAEGYPYDFRRSRARQPPGRSLSGDAGQVVHGLGSGSDDRPQLLPVDDLRGVADQARSLRCRFPGGSSVIRRCPQLSGRPFLADAGGLADGPKRPPDIACVHGPAQAGWSYGESNPDLLHAIGMQCSRVWTGKEASEGC